MPLLVQIILVVVPPVVAVAITRQLMLKWLPQVVIAHAEKVVPYILGTFGGFFGLVAGFMLSNSWLELRTLRSAMTAEVNAIADMGDIAVNLPQPRADELKRAINEYLRTVVDDELPLMAEGRVNPATTRALNGLWVPLGNYEPQAEWEVSIREIAINKAMDIGERRRQRVVFSRERLPPILWWILGGSGLVVVAGACVVSLKYRTPTGVFLGALTAFVALALFSIHVLERPFQYRLSPESSDYISVWKALGGPETITR